MKNAQTNLSMGYAFVDFLEEEGANSALVLHQTDFQGRYLNVVKSTNTLPDISKEFLPVSLFPFESSFPLLTRIVEILRRSQRRAYFVSYQPALFVY